VCFRVRACVRVRSCVRACACVRVCVASHKYMGAHLLWVAGALKPAEELIYICIYRYIGMCIHVHIYVYIDMCPLSLYIYIRVWQHAPPPDDKNVEASLNN